MSEKGVNIESLKNKIQENGHSLSRNSIGNILNERNSPKMDTLQLITDALEIDLFELFSKKDTQYKENYSYEIDGFIDYNGQVHRIRSKDDFRQVYTLTFGNDNKADVIEDQPTMKKPSARFAGGASLLARAKATRNSNKLQRRNVERFDITVSLKKELEGSNIPRDTKIWVFRSRQDEIKARKMLQEHLKYNFNT